MGQKRGNNGNSIFSILKVQKLIKKSIYFIFLNLLIIFIFYHLKIITEKVIYFNQIHSSSIVAIINELIMIELDKKKIIKWKSWSQQTISISRAKTNVLFSISKPQSHSRAQKRKFKVSRFCNLRPSRDQDWILWKTNGLSSAEDRGFKPGQHETRTNL